MCLVNLQSLSLRSSKRTWLMKGGDPAGLTVSLIKLILFSVVYAADVQQT